MYVINMSYTGYHPLPWPFKFLSLDDARKVAAALEALLKEVPEWEPLKKEVKISEEGYDGWV